MAETNGSVDMAPLTQMRPGLPTTLRAPDARSPSPERPRGMGTPEWYLYALATVIVLGFFGLTVTMILHDIPEKSQNVAYMLLGGLVTGFSMVLSYFFGSSAGSASKTAQLAELMKQPPKG